MAIQVGGTTVISDNRALTSVNGLKTVGGTSILGSGDIEAGGGTELAVVNANEWTIVNTANSISGGTNGVYGIGEIYTKSNANNDLGRSQITQNGTNSWMTAKLDSTGNVGKAGFQRKGVHVFNIYAPTTQPASTYTQIAFKLDAGANLVEASNASTGYFRVMYKAL